ncbi:FAD binding domain-containing protein [Albimonas pacifica]|uniref:Xanthine dehydrogenase YagS FAD-binding subunit n=1 Tax=Albimonas pacifica TaxID=1114924 RepID=A0A1I3FUL4_9RHOB|nr:xanthine dehydrogenase family protein subunit M [Albimonas pacifica]SFI14847.1 xanthine dehydrogenase YagS FAD-binding subunit [Albimonas pacifica]
MRPFQYLKATNVAGALRAGRDASDDPSATAYLAGGTTLLDLMKLDVIGPTRLIDLRALASEHGTIRVDGDALRLGAFASMAAAADHPDVRERAPVIAQSLSLAASAQLRNMATLGGNVLQRTRCAYFRDPSWAACNKRRPGSGCAAVGGANRQHAVLGAGADCIAAYPGDFAQALIALDATVRLVGPEGARSIAFSDLHRDPKGAPHLETTLKPGEIVTEFVVPAARWARRSLYLKIRDRQSYEFAVTSAAVALDIEDGVVGEARIALGGVATRPWRATTAEETLRGAVLTEARAAEAGRAAFAGAVAQSHNAFKIELGRRTIVRALLAAAAMEVDHG